MFSIDRQRNPGKRRGVTPNQSRRRERILEITRDHLARSGYDGLSMRELARGAGVSPTTLYNIYETKDQLVMAAVEGLIADLNNQAKHLSDPIERVFLQFRLLSAAVVARPLYAEAVTKLLFAADPEHRITEILFAQPIMGWIDILGTMDKAGYLRPGVNRQRVARTIVANSYSTNLLWMKGVLPLADFQSHLLESLADLLSAEMTAAGKAAIEQSFAAPAQAPAKPQRRASRG